MNFVATGYSSIGGGDSSSVELSKKIELVKKIALYLKSRIPDFFETDDLIQIGMVGLIEANNNFDSSRGVSFEEYAKRRIKGAILDEVRKASNLSRLAVKNNREYAAATESLTNSLGRAPSNQEIAKFLNITISELEHRRSHANQFNIVQLEDELAQADENFEDTNSNPLLGIEDDELTQRLADEISKLDDRTRLIISLYYVEELNMKEIGAVIGVNESRVSQILKSAAATLRESLK